MTTAVELAVNKGEAADAKRFFTVGLALIDLLNSLSEDAGLTWQIADLRLGSAIATIAPDDTHVDEAKRVIHSLDKGLEQIRSGNADDLDWGHRAREQAKVFFDEADETTVLSYGNNQNESIKRVPITPELKAEISSLDGIPVSHFGSIRGRLTGVNISKGHRASIIPFNGSPTVKVQFPADQEDIYKQLLYEDVSIEGTIHQLRASPPQRIVATKITQIDESNVTWMDLWGIMPEITEGKSVKEYLEDIRGEAG